MFSAGTIVFYALIFCAVYMQVFLFVTFIERRKEIPSRKGALKLGYYPSVTIVVPCCNEEVTLRGTVNSVLNLDYPKDKLHLILVDDGSTDKTLGIMKEYEDMPNVQIFSKERGGKFTALNLALGHVTTELVGSLDADSFVHPLAMQRVAKLFNDDPMTMSIVSSIMIHRPQNLLQRAQKLEYEMSIFFKNMLALIGGLHVTPGPFSIFRKEVFDHVGLYKKAHNTEDGEMALRLQKNGYKISYCTDSYVYTVAPKKVGQLFRQRVRWTYGFIRNLVDYRELIFKRRYGNLSFFTLPSAIISFLTIVTMSVLIIVRIAQFFVEKAHQVDVVGLQSVFSLHSFDWLSIHTGGTIFLILLLYTMSFLMIGIGRKVAQERLATRKDFLSLLSFVVVSSTVAPLWILKSLFDAIRAKKTAWK